MVSSVTVKKMIQDLVGQEDEQKPLSDQEIARSLKQRGLSIARRTVAKYREELGILPSHQRRLATQQALTVAGRWTSTSAGEVFPSPRRYVGRLETKLGQAEPAPAEDHRGRSRPRAGEASAHWPRLTLQAKDHTFTHEAAAADF